MIGNTSIENLVLDKKTFSLAEAPVYEVLRINPDGWNEYKDDIMHIENSSFEPGVRENEGEIAVTFLDKNAINYIVKNAEGKVIGYMANGPIENYDYIRDESKDVHFGKNDSLYIESIAVMPEFRNMEIGNTLLEWLIKDSGKEDYSRITLHATSKIMVSLAKKNGFKKLEYIDRWVGERDAWYMEKILSTKQ